MTFDALIIDKAALNALDAAMIDDEWFSNFILPKNSEGIRRIVVDSYVYILSDHADINSPLLVINVGPGGVLDGAARPRTRFERILRVALRKFDRHITLPVQWQVYHEGSRLSVFSDSISSRGRNRIYFEQSAGDQDLYAYTVTETPRPLLQVNPDDKIYKGAKMHFEEAALTEDSPDESVGSYGILLSERLGVQLAHSGTLNEWVDRRLNKDQLAFLRKSHDAPVRLRGAAGSGKTQAMAVKCLRDIYADADEGGNQKTFAFLTHSSSLAHEVVRGMFYTLDPSGRWSQLKNVDGIQKLWIGTIYERAQEQLNYAQKGLTPLSLDGRDGRAYQRLLIEDGLQKITHNPRVM